MSNIKRLLEDIEELLKGRRAQIGEIRTWSGKEYQKTITGWVPVKKDSRPHNKIKQVTEKIKEYLPEQKQEGQKVSDKIKEIDKQKEEIAEQRTKLKRVEPSKEVKQELEDSIGKPQQSHTDFWESIYVEESPDAVELTPSKDSFKKAKERFKELYGMDISGFSTGRRAFNQKETDQLDAKWSEHLSMIDLVLSKMPIGFTKNNEFLNSISNKLDYEDKKAAARYLKKSKEIEFLKGSAKYDRIFYVDDINETNSFFVECIAHELAHPVALKFAKESETHWKRWRMSYLNSFDENKPINKKEIKLVSNYAYTDAHEAFAETFAVYFTHKNKIDALLSGKEKSVTIKTSRTTSLTIKKDDQIYHQMKFMKERVYDNEKINKSFNLKELLEVVEKILK